ncbi:MAG: DUF58 domain-containing protein [Actinomycetes bacterium]
MRAALSALTPRGRTFLTVGVTASIMALVFGQSDVLRVGILVTALPLLSALSVSRTRFRLACNRRVEPSRVPVGEASSIVLRLENIAALPTGLLLVEDRVPLELGARPRFVIDRLAPRSHRDVSYEVRSDARGRFLVGPLVLRVADPFGLCALDRSFAQRDALVVTPAVEYLPSVSIAGDWSGHGDSRARSVAAAGEDDVAVRDYRRGDELRRVHWPSTARQGQLMVRREEQPWESRSAVLLDTRSRAHRGRGIDSSFERAVSAAASVGVHLSRRGFAVRLVGASGPEVTSAAHQPATHGGDNEGFLLDALAVVTSRSTDTMEGLATAARHHGDSLMVAVLGHVDADDAERLVRARHGMGTSVAVLMTTGDWVPDQDPKADRLRVQADQAATLLRTSGWRIVQLGRRQLLADAWQQAAYHGQGHLRTSGLAS